ncbi:ABC transporter substrate-binding protein [Paenibacillaceae bacterium WGS1546]|uniref:ABC transporter substrate-binding protein n=1 Tax=Cohnella sp. WGS1546 TaxID=3366810 RepID=UPI00372CF310
MINKWSGTKGWTFAALALTLILVLSACSSSNGGDPSNEGAPSSSASASASGVSQTVTVAINGDIQNFNPYTNQSVDFFTIRYNVFDTLVKYDSSMKIEANLATEWKQDSDTQWTFTLSDGIVFHNGDTLTAEDVKYSIDSALNPDRASFFASDLKNISSVEGEGNQVVIKLSKPDPVLLSTFANFPIVPNNSFDALSSNPIGTGPFQFVSWEAGDKIVLQKNPDYWKGDTTNIDTLVVRPITDAAVRLSNLISGTIDVVATLDPNQLLHVNAREDYIILEPESSNKTVLAEVVLNNNEAFKNPKVMQALVRALDKNDIKKNVYQGYGNIIWSPFPSNDFGYKEGTAYPFDIEESKKLLAEAGYDNGISFTLILPTGFSDLEQIAVIWQAGLKKAGVDMKIEKMELNSWVDKYVARDYEMTLNIYPQSGNDASIYANLIMIPLFEKSLPDPSEALALIEDASSTTDEAKRLELYAKLQDLVSEQAPIIPIQEVPIAAGVSNKITGLEIYPTSYVYFGNAQVN